MARIVLSGEGQAFDLPDDVAGNDQALKDTLTPMFPQLANCEIQRTRDGDTMVVTVVKRAGTKGLAPAIALPAQLLDLATPAEAVFATSATGPLLKLIEAPPEMHPAMALVYELMDRQADSGDLPLEERIELSPRIEEAQQAISESRDRGERILRALKVAVPQPSRDVPVGF